MLTYKTRFPVALRLGLLLISLFPLWGAYDLLFGGVRWNSYFNFFFLFVLVIALGAFSLFAGLAAAAIFGMAQKIIIDPKQGKVIRSWRNFLPQLRREEYPFNYVRDIEVLTHVWSEGPDSYSLRLHLTSGEDFPIVEMTDRKLAHAEAAKIRVAVGLPEVN